METGTAIAGGLAQLQECPAGSKSAIYHSPALGGLSRSRNEQALFGQFYCANYIYPKPLGAFMAASPTRSAFLRRCWIRRSGERSSCVVFTSLSQYACLPRREELPRHASLPAKMRLHRPSISSAHQYAHFAFFSALLSFGQPIRIGMRLGYKNEFDSSFILRG